MVSEEQLDVDGLTAELERLASRVLPRVFKRLSSKDGPLVLSQLQIIAERDVPDQWKEDRVAALEIILRRGIERLDGTFADTISQQRAAFILFNLTGAPSFPEIEPLPLDSLGGTQYSHIYQRLQNEAGGDYSGRSTVRREINRLRVTLAQVLIGSSTREIERTLSGVHVVRSVLADDYVARPDYEHEIRQLRDAGESHVWLWGDAGTGKTRLARAANRDRIAERAVPILTASNEQALLDQFADLVVKSGIDPADVNSGNRKAWFIAQLNKGRLPKVLVFDDMPPDRELVKTLTSTQASFIIFTSSEHPPPPPDGYAGPSLEVRDMTADESEQMIRSRLPDAREEEVHQLNATLAGRPLAVEHSCSFLRETGMSVADYCTALARQPARTLDAAGGQHGRTLTRVYELTLGRLADSPDIVRTLDYILFTQRSLLTEDMLSYLWVDSLGIPSPEAAASLMQTLSPYVLSMIDVNRWPDMTCPKVLQIPYVDPIATVSLHTGLRRLASFGIIRTQDGRLLVHQLTRFILRALRHDQVGDVYERIRTTAHALLKLDEWEPGEPLSGDMISWAPHVAAALDPYDSTASDVLSALSVDDVKKLALLGAMVVCAHRQIGVSVTEAINSVKHVNVIVSLRAWWQGYDETERQQLFDSFFSFHREIMTPIILSAGFSRELDGALSLNKVTPEVTRFASRIRFDYDTEWELSHNLVNADASQHFPEKKAATVLEGADIARLKGSAHNAMLFSRICYDRCHWTDAIAALEHAYSCYIKIGGDIGAIRGAIDAARRLARVYLRAGPTATTSDTLLTGYLDEASEWLARAGQVRWRRSDAILNDKRSRFRLYDVLLDAQLNQVTTQIELTRQVLAWEDMETEITPEALAQFVSEPYQYANGAMSTYSRIDEAQEALALLQRIRGLRLVPEFKMQLARLYMLASDPRAQDCTTDLETWFTREELSYQTDLLDVQRLALATPFTAMLFVPEAADVLADHEQLDQHQEEMQAARDNPTRVSDRYYTAARTIGTRHNPYWYARGLAAALIIGTVAERERSWIDGLRAELDQAATRIGRTDWIDKANSYGDTNAGLWLLGY